MKKLMMVLLFAAAVLQAVEVTPEQAQTAVSNWIRLGPRRMDSEFQSRNAENIKTVRGKTGRAVYHAVNLEGGGFVVTSGDTRLPPIIAFSDKGRYGDGETGPFHALLQKSLSHAVSVLERSDHGAAVLSDSVKNGANAYAAAIAEWNALLPSEEADAGRLLSNAGGSRKNSLSDVRVDKLIKTEWGQGGIAIYNWNEAKEGWDEVYYPSFDYYTPTNYPCGCVATVGAQIMNYWRMPQGSIAQFSNTCIVDDKEVTRTSVAGAFDWDNMYLAWAESDPIPSLEQRQAVGMLTYNIAVAVGMKWGDWYGSSSPTLLIQALKDRFGYKSGTFIWHDIDAFNKPGADTPDDLDQRLADFNNALYASLDAQMPVVMSIDGDDGGHAIIADGYGYTSGKRYTHLNFGWYGSDDAWYYLVDELLLVRDDKESYSVFEGVGCNIHPSVAGDVVSGRVLDASGSSVSGVTVKLYDASNNLKASVISNAKGIYSFRITEAGDYTVQTSSESSDETPSKAVSIPSLSREGSFSTDKSHDWAGWTGNKWGVDLQFTAVIPETPPDPETPDPESSSTFTVTFDASEGSVSQSSRSVAGGSAVGDLPTATRSGYVFVGWFTAASGGTKIDATTKVTANVTYYAQWTAEGEKPSQDGNDVEWSYRAVGDNIEIFKKSLEAAVNPKPTGELAIPSQIDGKTVTSLGSYAFYKCDALTSVTIPDTVTKLGWGTFMDCTKLNSVQIPGSVTSIDGKAFDGTALETVLVAKGDTEKVRKLLADSGYDVSNVNFVESMASWTVTFDANGGSATEKTRSVASGAAVGDLPTATRSGYVFDGWFTAASAGTQVSASTKVTANVTWYAHWSSMPTPEPTPCYTVLSASDIVAPYSAPKMVTLKGTVYDGCNPVGIVDLKLGKVNARKGTSKVSGALTDLFGKKHIISAYNLAGVDGKTPKAVSLEVKDYGTMTVTIGGTQFAGSLGKYHVQSDAVGGDLGRNSVSVDVWIDDITMFNGEVLWPLLPDADGVRGSGSGKWAFEKATSVKFAKVKDPAAMRYPEYFHSESGKGLVVGAGNNLSGMKLTYTPKKGTFKGSFKVYALEGEDKATKLKKYTVNVTGVVVNGVGYGMATCKRPAAQWQVVVK